MTREELNEILEFVLDNEGALADDPRDPGKLTIWGISEKWHPEAVRKMRSLPFRQAREIAKEIYEMEYAAPFMDFSKEVGLVTIDAAVQFAPNDAARLLQEAANKTKGRVVLKVDGIVGPKTRGVIKEIEKNLAEKIILIAIFTFLRINKHLDNRLFAVYGRGWVARSIRVGNKALEWIRSSVKEG